MVVTGRARRVAKLLALVVVGVLALGACSSSDGDQPADGADPSDRAAGVLRLGVVGPLELDPAVVVVGEEDMIGLDLVYDTLPDLAAGQPNADLTVWRYELADVAFADGTPITADDVKFTLERVAQPGEQSLRGARLDVIAGYDEFVDGSTPGMSGLTVVDESTLEITTSDPYGELDRLLVDPVFGVVPKQMVEDDEDFWSQPVGSGPFRITDTSDDGLTLGRSEGSEARLEGVEIIYFDSVGDSYDAFAEGDVDWSEVPPGEYDAASENYGDAHFAPQNIEFWFGMNLRNPKFQNQLFREAIVHAIDRAGLVEEFFPGSLLLNGVVPQGVPGAQDNACRDRCVYAPDVSRDLVADAFPDGDVPTVMVDYTEEDFEREAAEVIAADLEAVGIPTELRPHAFADYRAFVVGGEQEFFLFGWIGVGETPDTYLAPLFLSDSPDNVTGYNLGFADGGIAAARAVVGEEERLAGYQQVETAIVGQVPLVPLVQLRSHAVVSDRVHDLVTDVDGSFDAEAVSVD